MAVDNNMALESESVLEVKTPEKLKPASPSISPTTSRYGRTRKLKLSNDFVSTDKNLRNFLTPSVNLEVKLTNVTDHPSVSLKRENSTKKELPSSGVEHVVPCLNGTANNKEDKKSSENRDIRDFFGKSSSGNGSLAVSKEITPINPTTPSQVTSTESPVSQSKSEWRGKKKIIQTSDSDQFLGATTSVSSESGENVSASGLNDSIYVESPCSSDATKISKPRGRPPRSRVSFRGKEKLLNNVQTLSANTNNVLNISDSPALESANLEAYVSLTHVATVSANTPVSPSAASPSDGAPSNLITPSSEIPGLSKPAKSRVSIGERKSLRKIQTPTSASTMSVRNMSNSPAVVSAYLEVSTSLTPTTAALVNTPLSSCSVSLLDETPSNLVSPGSEVSEFPNMQLSVGDVTWSSVGKQSYWPCIIMNDPATNKHFQVQGNVRKRVLYFVQFCGDNGRHSRLSAQRMMEFISKQEFFNSKAKVFQDSHKRTVIGPKFLVKPHQIDAWEKAVEEAELLMTLARDERIKHFQRLYPMPELKRTKKDILELLFAEEDKKKPDDESSKASNHKESTKSTSTGSKLSLDSQSKECMEIKDEKPSLQKIKIVKSRGLYKLKTNKSKNPLKLTLKKKVLPKKKLALLKKKKLKKFQLQQKGKKDKMKRAYRKKSKAITAESASIARDENEIDPIEENKVKKVGINGFSVSSKDSKTKTKLPKKKKRKKRKEEFGPDFDMYCSKNFDRIADDHPNLKDEEIEKYLQKMWLELDEMQKLKYKSRLVKTYSSASEEEDEAESEESEAENETPASDPDSAGSTSGKSSPLPIVESVSKTRKMNNLFRGFKNEKICMICEKGGQTFKCQGTCQGHYHKDCVSRSISSNDSNSLVKQNESSVKDEELEKKEESNEELAEESVEKKEGSNEELAEESNAVNTKESKVGGKSTKSKSNDCGKEGNRSEILCQNCESKKIPLCFECGEDVQPKTNEHGRVRCQTPCCGRYYHPSCALKWPQAIITNGSKRKDLITGQIVSKVLTCPQHVCHTCVSDNPGVVKERSMFEKQIVKCIKCPTAYHSGNYCVPAGSEILTSSQIICPRHYNPPKNSKTAHINANWCFICAIGGDLICCDLCPTSFHAQCVDMTPDEYEAGYTCDDCRTGRFPLFGEIVWVKLGNYRWWPAQILFPHEIPDKIMNISHTQGEFAVQFFGSNDYYWVNRGRTFLYQEGDSSGKVNNQSSKIGSIFAKAVKEARVAHQQWCSAKTLREEGARQGMKPPHYGKIKVNKPTGNLKQVDLNTSGLTACECDPKSENPCASDNDCLNRMLMVECNPIVCKAGERCNNQRFEKRLYPPVEPFRTEKRGWGLRTMADIKKGDFVIEYVGEIIDEREYKERVERMKRKNDANFYFLTIDQHRMLDAGPKGNVARFMNHSCDPNCETQKWTVNGDTRVGLFALKDIPQNSELVFNYNLDTGTAEKQSCLCGAASCRGYIGAKKVEKSANVVDASADKKTVKRGRKGKENKKVKKRRAVSSVVEDDSCFICDEGGELIVCNNKTCPRVYHLDCLGKKSYPKGKWLCPWHSCDVCAKRKVLRCGLCVSSFCKEHKAGNIRFDPDRGLYCKKHFDEMGTDKLTDQNLSQSLLLDDGDQVTISTPKNDESSQSILSDDLGTPIPECQSRTNSVNDVALQETNSSLKRVRCSLAFDDDQPVPAKREKLDSSDLASEKVEVSATPTRSSKLSVSRNSEKVLTDLNNLVQ